MLEKIAQTADYILSHTTRRPKTAIILGTGLGQLATQIEEAEAIPYGEIPNMPVSTVEGHSGKLIRVMKALGIETLFVSNAAGGTNSSFRVGDLMIIEDHINLFPEHPLRGKNYDELGPRFPDMSEPYDFKLIKLAEQIAAEKGVHLQKGVYIGTQGPTFETRAEYRYFRNIGGDAVGMSTVPEVIVAHHAGMRVFGVSVITDLGGFGIPEKASHEEVQKAANAAQPIMTMIMSEMIRRS